VPPEIAVFFTIQL